MKKYLLLLILFIFAMPIFSKSFNFANEYLSFDFVEEGNNLYLSQIKDVKNNIKYIKNPSKKPLWQFKVKKNKDYAGEEITLTPSMGDFFYGERKNVFDFAWVNVKTSDMEEGFNVVCSIELNKGDSYWRIKISPNKDYGIWNVDYPHISALDVQDGDKFANPIRGGNIIDEFSNEKGMLYPANESEERFKDIGYYLPIYMQWVSLTKGDNTLYVSVNDPRNNLKTFNFTLFKPNEMDLTTINYPAHMAEGGHEYFQQYDYNIAVFKGDYFDSCKKYRDWGIKYNYGPFANGKMELRKDLPNWWKKSAVAVQWNVNEPECVNSLIYTMDYLKIPMLVHAYLWNDRNYDTCYPKWLPVRDGFIDDFNKLKSMGYYVMPYTNGHLVDTALSPFYEKYGNDLIVLNEKGEAIYESWSEELGAKNACACPNRIYKDCYLGEVNDIMKEFKFDALYSDQVGASMPNMCFNPSHKHSMGGGNFYYESYERLINDMRKSLSKEKGLPVVLTTEDCADPYPFDGWLRCNEDLSRNADTPFNTIVYSGYAISFGSNYFPKEFENEFSAINKTSVAFSKGIEPGWSVGNRNQFEKYPTFAKHFKNMALARYEASDYFNLGEMIRPVNITSPIPTKKLYWENIYGNSNREHKMVRTCSYHYKGKTMVAFINSSDEEINVNWEATPKDMCLSEKKAHDINPFYPKEMEFVNNSTRELIKSSFTLPPLETVIFVVSNQLER